MRLLNLKLKHQLNFINFARREAYQHPANRTHNRPLHTRPATWKNHSTKYHTQQPLYNTLELLMMGMVMPETC